MAKTQTHMTELSTAKLNEILSMPDSEEDQGASIFDRNNNISVLDDDPEEEESEEAGEEESASESGEGEGEEEEESGEEGEEEEGENVLDIESEKKDSKPVSTTGKTGRPVYGAIKSLIDDEILFPFEEEGGKVKNIEEYSQKDIVELIRANVERVREEEGKKAPVEFFESLPEELQAAAAYYANGGKDLKSLFRHLAEVKETEVLDVNTPDGQEQVVRLFLKENNFGTPDEIEAEISEIKDRTGELEKKAAQFKPKLETIRQKRVEAALKQQEAARKKEDQMIATYRQSVYSTLAKGELDGIKLTSKTQGEIYQSMINSLQTLGNLLHQNGVKTDLEHVAELTWLLKDRQGFKDAVKKSGASTAAQEAARKLKTESGKTKSTASSTGASSTKKPIRTIPRQKANFFE